MGRLGSGVALLACLASPLAAALPNPPQEDIHWTTEHLPESAMDARYLALPLVVRPPARGRWQTLVDAGYLSSRAAFMHLDGTLAAVGVAYAPRDRWAIEGLGFVDRLRVGGGDGREVLRATFADRPVPLDLPEVARFSNPRGVIDHWGLGAVVAHQSSVAVAERYWSWTAGLLWEHLALRGYRLDYVMEGGATAGAAGVLDHSSTADYLTPLLGLRWTRPLGRDFTLAPWGLAAVPLPNGKFSGEISGPGFAIRDNGRGRIGDPYVAAGLAIEHQPSDLELDLGSALWFAFGEGVIHHGIDRALLVHLTWRR